ncbi:sugar phosphate isomerase/epimerase [Caproiciproducens sp. NJN-50]|nr:sugar phosphate isomerase/epimerase [Caproiciproducens sp. NJN-50]
MNCFGINLWNWVNGLGRECSRLPEKIARMGFTAIELPMTQPGLDLELKQEIEATGLETSLCAALGPGRDLSNFDAAVRASTMEYLTGCLLTAESLGCHIFAGPLYAGGGKRHRLPPGEAVREWELAVAGLKELARRAKEHGVRLALEPLNRYRTSVVNTAAQGLKLVKDIGEENVGIHFDTFHAGIEENDLPGAIESVLKAGKMYHFHACANNRGAPGQGFFPWTEIFGLLKDYGYEGHITMETFAPGGLDSGWVQLGEGPDQLAEFGIAYLKKVFSK